MIVLLIQTRYCRLLSSSEEKPSPSFPLRALPNVASYSILQAMYKWYISKWSAIHALWFMQMSWHTAKVWWNCMASLCSIGCRQRSDSAGSGYYASTLLRLAGIPLILRMQCCAQFMHCGLHKPQCMNCWSFWYVSFVHSLQYGWGMDQKNVKKYKFCCLNAQHCMRKIKGIPASLSNVDA